MAISIVTTIGAADSNSYQSIEELDEAFENRLNAAGWSDLSDEVKKQYAIESTEILNNFNWLGSPITNTQALAFPRSGCPNPKAIGCWTYFAIDIIPTPVKKAQIEIINALILDGANGVIANGNDGLSAIKIGDMSLTFSHQASNASADSVIKSSKVNTILRGMFTGAIRVRA